MEAYEASQDGSLGDMSSSEPGGCHQVRLLSFSGSNLEDGVVGGVVQVVEDDVAEGAQGVGVEADGVDALEVVAEDGLAHGDIAVQQGAAAGQEGEGLLGDLLAGLETGDGDDAVGGASEHQELGGASEVEAVEVEGVRDRALVLGGDGGIDDVSNGDGRGALGPDVGRDDVEGYCEATWLDFMQLDGRPGRSSLPMFSKYRPL